MHIRILFSLAVIFFSVQAFPCGRSGATVSVEDIEEMKDRQKQEINIAFNTVDGSVAVNIAHQRLDNPGKYLNAYIEAMKLFEYADSKGNSEGANGLGIIYAEGYGVTPDLSKSMVYFKRAISLGCKDAERNLNDVMRIYYIDHPIDRKTF